MAHELRRRMCNNASLKIHYFNNSDFFNFVVFLFCLNKLSENICKFAPAWSTEFKPLCASASCYSTESYASLLKAIPNEQDAAMAFVQYQTRLNAINSNENGNTWVSSKGDS